MSRVWHPFSAPDLGAVTKRQPGRANELAEGHVADQRQDLAFERTQVDDLPELPLPLADRPLAISNRSAAPLCSRTSVGDVHPLDPVIVFPPPAASAILTQLHLPT